MKVERSIDIKAAPQTVYEVIMDPNRLGDWVSIHKRLEAAPDGSLRKGSTLTQCLKLAGRTFKVRWKVVENDRADHVVWEGQGPLRSKAKVVYDLSPGENGETTHFSYLNEYDLPGGALGKMAGPAVRKVTGRELDASLENLRKILE
jgi:carbon monoxide dehydrogenase subunit G